MTNLLVKLNASRHQQQDDHQKQKQHGQNDDQQQLGEQHQQQPSQKTFLARNSDLCFPKFFDGAGTNDQNAVFLRAARAANIDQVLEFMHGGIDYRSLHEL
ncbi:hypothetical protein niasHT_006169 [Heterodera trifolii]|uniref:Uncharacterized protein n=1 Tax=Heterodera trifolii TaxID=157864 RepID=A0ABD2M2X1_9BILA